MPIDNDVLIVGGGLAGCIAAVTLARAGLSVRVIDRSQEPLNEFRAEQIVGGQTERLRQLGLLEPLVRHARCTKTTGNYRRGAFLDQTHVEQYGLPYQAMVQGIRSALPSGCLITARVVRIETGPSIQTVHFANGHTMTSRLVVLATGLMPHLAQELGIGWDMKSEQHSLCLGFGMAFEDATRVALVPFTYYRETIRERIDYLTLFHMDGKIRANLFSYRRREDPWIRAFMDRPDEALKTSMPGLAKVIGASKVIGPVDVRRNDIKVATNVEQDGVVLIGDAFQSPCPAAGHGIDRILSDVETLERLIPSWFATAGLDAGKIAQYYADPAKRAFDAECLRVARYRRDVSTNGSPRWTLHRLRVDIQRQVKRRLKFNQALAANSRSA